VTLADPVQAQLDAYNAQDVEAFVACYAADVRIEDADGKLQLQGHDAMRERYAKLFAEHPANRAELLHRIAIGEHVIDHERITGRGPEPLFAVAIYRVRNGLIEHVRFIR
jgi:hypothetical protein